MTEGQDTTARAAMATASTTIRGATVTSNGPAVMTGPEEAIGPDAMIGPDGGIAETDPSSGALPNDQHARWRLRVVT